MVRGLEHLYEERLIGLGLFSPEIWASQVFNYTLLVVYLT